MRRMSDDISISGGSTEVVSDALLAAHAVLGSLSVTLDELAHDGAQLVEFAAGLHHLR